MNTSCKKCHYAIYDGKTQTGCQMNRLDKWREKTNVIEAYDEEKEFYVIQNRNCNAYNEWNTLSPEEAREKIKLPYTIMLINGQIDLFRESELGILPREILCGSETTAKTKYKFTRFLQPLTPEEMEYELTKQVQTPFYIVGTGPINNPFLEKCERMYNEDLEKFVVIEDSETGNVLKSVRAVQLSGPNLDKLKEDYPGLCLQA